MGSILLHGDAAFAGQGVVYETLSMQELRHYGTGGTIHVVVNNQIGFTTDAVDSRSGPYCTDIAKSAAIPIFHVNGEDPEAVARVSEIAAEWRHKFKKDVVIDLVCYRRHGHNEVDEPKFTQPHMYDVIRKHPSAFEVYSKRLVANKDVTQADVDALSDRVMKWLEDKFEASKTYKPNNVDHDLMAGAWADIAQYAAGKPFPSTGVRLETLRAMGERVFSLPASFNAHKNIAKIYEQRVKCMSSSGTDVDWGTAEALAFGSLLDQGVHVRLSGQDSQRGTFSHRHAVLHDQVDFAKENFVPLDHVSADQAGFVVANSHLSEFGVLGFEYGYSLENPMSLVLWEAQFGDFTNGAQVILDQFLCSAESKWRRQSGLVMLLPHAYEGAGPEHSSARLERFLQNSDDDPFKYVNMSTPELAEAQIRDTNWQVVNITSPANFFHVLRRQIMRSFRKPLVVMTPKSLLKHRLAKSSLLEMADNTHFRPVIGDSQRAELTNKPADIRRLIFCSGKVYFDLVEERERKKICDVAIARIEQLCPFPFSDVAAEAKKYPQVWCSISLA